MSTEAWVAVEGIFATHPCAQEILRRLVRGGYDAVLVGGVVRDALLAQFEGKEYRPKDVDIATAARPEEVKKLFPRWRTAEVGESFGVLRLVAPDGKEYEVATYRVESEYDGRWPGKVALVRDLAGDLKRRDFTINGLAAREDGRVIDLVGGIQDLKNRVIRAIGDPQQRFKEDYLRMIRAIRCACLIGGRLSTEVSQAINQNREKIRLISWERIRDELLRLLETPRAARGIALLEEHGILELILPELLTTKGVKQPEKYHPEGDVYTHTLLALELADRLGFEPLVKLAILLHDIGKPAAYERNRGENMAGHEAMGEELAGRVGRRLRLSNEQVRIIRYLIRQHLRVAIFPEMARAKQIRFVKEDEARKRGFNDLVGRFPLFARLLQLLIADCEASVHRSSGWLPVLEAFVGLLPQFRHLEELEGARKLIDGHDILELGVEEGPEVGRILEEVYDRILSGRIASREQALKAAEELAEKDNVVG